MKQSLLAIAIAWAFSPLAQAGNQTLSLKVLGQHQTGIFAQGAAEIVAYDANTRRVFKVNAQAATIDVLDISNPASPSLVGTIDASALGGSANSVAVKKGNVAVAIEATDKQAPGLVAFYKASDLTLQSTVTVGALPDMVTFSPDGRYVLVANEGEPNDDYTVDPEGSVSVIDIRGGVKNAKVRTADFTAFNGMEAALRAKGVRIFGPGATVAKDLEPEYITFSNDSRYAWVSLQEANALALVDVKLATVLEIQPLGTKDHSVLKNALDASDKDKAINIAQWPVQGMYMPDAISSYSYRGDTFIVTANEGDSRDYAGFSEEARVKDLTLDPTAFPNATDLKNDAQIGRLKTTLVNGDTDGDGDVDVIYTFGGRSFSIRNSRGELVFDSGSDFETRLAALLPAQFNSSHDSNNSFDSRSDDKGPEPEGVALGAIGDHVYAFIGLERIGGIMVYDVTNPHAPEYVTYINNRNFSVDATTPAAGDLGPEGLTFISAGISPNKKPLLVVGNEVSGTTTVYQINVKATK
jgi:hypothetical protein